MSLNDIELSYLRERPRGALVTVAPDGAPQAKPVGFRYNDALGTIDIAGFRMASSAKYHNIQGNSAVVFMVEDAIGEGPEGMRFLEVRGTAETAVAEPADPQLSPEIIRVHPRRTVGWNVDPHRQGRYTRNIR
jgi:pyridoxamine 5'-phosphate oxidase family protein